MLNLSRHRLRYLDNQYDRLKPLEIFKPFKSELSDPRKTWRNDQNRLPQELLQKSNKITA